MPHWNQAIVSIYVKRTHLYLSLVLMPWFLMYGITSLPFNHSGLFQEWFADDGPDWVTVWEKEFRIGIPEGEDKRVTAKRILDEQGIDRLYGAWIPYNGRINIYLYDFRGHSELAYFIHEDRLVLRDRVFRWNEFMTSLHARGGYHQDSWLSDAWALIVDLFCLSMLVWIATGLWMWWQMKRVRLAGGIVMGAGLLTYLGFLFLL